MSELQDLARSAARGRRLDDTQARRLAALAATDPQLVVATAGAVRDETTGPRITYSRKVFIPLTKLCRDACGYCTFAHPPIEGQRAFLTLDEVLAIAKEGEAAGCREALFTLGEKPERKWRQARDELNAMGFSSTVDYLAEACRAVLEHTSLLPHTNPGTLTYDEAITLKEVSVSQGMMLETLSERLLKRGFAHFGAPDKKPAVRLATLENAGNAEVAFTTGILIGIGETEAERVEALLAIRDSHERHGHIQEVIIQNFRAKADTLMAEAPELPVDEIVTNLALARLILPPDIALQAPPNLTPGEYGTYIDSGINDWGGVSPVTIDHVNPEAPWPKLRELTEVTEARGYSLTQRLAIYPAYCESPTALDRWLHRDLRPKVLDAIDGEGFPRTDDWYSGADHEPPPEAALAIDQGLAGAYRVPGRAVRPQLNVTFDKVDSGTRLDEDEIALLFTAHGAETERLFATADRLRQETVGDEVTYVVNRNINYTNMCYFKCGFCAFSKGPKSLNLRGEPYLLSPEEVAQRAREAWELGATEVCMQGGIHHSFTADNYLEYLSAVKKELPEMHVHAFTALEVAQGARASGLSIENFLIQLREAGLKTLPGTAAEILDDDIRAIICPDKITTEEWCDVHRIAHHLGLRSNATIMFGTVEGSRNWARHLAVVRSLHDSIANDGHAGLFEFVPLPFVHMAAPIYLRGKARRGPTFSEALKMHAVARIALHGSIDNIQVSWVKMGVEGSKLALQAGANDLGGTLMNENISRAAGATHGQELTPDSMVELIRSIGRVPRRRTTLYETVTA